MGKLEIREEFKKRRFAQEPSDAAHKSARICERLLGMACVRDAGQVLVYAAARGEVDLSALTETLWERGKTVAFPACEGTSMDFYAVNGWDGLAEGYFRIQEPIDRSRPIVPDKDTVVCVPGVAFSDKGERIGMGKGYYDRYFDRFPEPYRIGIGYAFQTGPEWTADPQDVPMHCVVTEEAVLEPGEPDIK